MRRGGVAARPVATVAVAAFTVIAMAVTVVVARAEPPPPPEDGEIDEPAAGASASPSASAARAVHGPPTRITVPIQDGMFRVPGGSFTMGSSDPAAPANERPPRQVTVAPFWIDRTEVTVRAYRACVDKHACARPARSSPTCTYDLDDPELPVSCVHFKDAEAYCRSSGKRLPREAEWELAARGPSPVRYPSGSAFTSCAVAVTLARDTGQRSCALHPARVGTHPQGASVFGVLDMSGNVEEWTNDWYTENVAEGARPRSGSSHVLRGGGWLTAPSASRTTSRSWASSVEAGPNVGFRCARD